MKKLLLVVLGMSALVIAVLACIPILYRSLQPTLRQPLHELLSRGSVIVALNTPHSVLGQKLKIPPTPQDIPNSRKKDGFVIYSLYVSYHNSLQRGSLAGQITDIVRLEHIAAIPNVSVKQIIERRNEPYIPQQVIESNISLHEKLDVVSEWLVDGCLWHDC